MKYYTINNQTQAFYSEGATEITNPVRDDGTLLPKHENLKNLELDPDGNYAEFYSQDGTIDTGKVNLVATGKVLTEVNTTVQDHLDNQAKLCGYDDINSISKYLGYDNKYRVEAEGLAKLTADTWEYTEAQMIEVTNGNRDIPSGPGIVLEIKANVVFGYKEVK